MFGDLILSVFLLCASTFLLGVGATAWWYQRKKAPNVQNERPESSDQEQLPFTS